MSSWLDPVARALDARLTPVELFVRDDDAGWADERLWVLLDVMGGAGMPMDLAAIPSATGPDLASALVERINAGAQVGVHQHGTTHVNHEAEGRKCEFGPSRGFASQRADVEEGRAALRRVFGSRLDPIFTPPWNRCTRDTGEALLACGISVLSRDQSACALHMPGLTECPIALDWFAKVKGQRLDRVRWGRVFACDIGRAQSPTGLMLHHAAMDDEDMRACEALMTLVAGHPAVRRLLMRDAARAIETGRRVA